MLDEYHEPNEEEIITTIGRGQLWQDLRNYIDQSYDFSPEMVFYGKKYGWTIRYRKGGKTLISLFPEYGAFTALIVLGKKEIEKVMGVFKKISPSTRALYENSKYLHDGKWLWIRVHKPSHVEDVKRLLLVKRKPQSNSDLV